MWRKHIICKYLAEYELTHAIFSKNGIGHFGVKIKDFKDFVIKKEGEKWKNRKIKNTETFNKKIRLEIKNCWGRYIEPDSKFKSNIKLTPEGQDLAKVINALNAIFKDKGYFFSFLLGSLIPATIWLVKQLF